jgi:hypothetical protein|nr:MAG TPA: hypothetical protein [Caudoviricetes sp.]
MDECINRDEFIEAVKDIPMWGSAAAMLADSIPAADVAPIEALERLRDELCAQDLITMEGLRKLNTLIWKYTTVHDGG